MENKTKASYSIVNFRGHLLPEQYLNMVLSKWLRSLKYGNDYFKIMDNDSYFEHYNKFILHILNRPTTTVRLAVLTDDHDVVLGWSVYSGLDTLHFVHVHKDMRKQGIGKYLMPKDVTTFTHMTRVGISLWSSHYQDVIFNPFA